MLRRSAAHAASRKETATPHAEPDTPFWERPEIVELFAGRPPDLRMRARLECAGRDMRVLDLGCAGGRNAAWLAEHGFDVFAVDASPAMVAKTRERIAEHVGAAEAERRVVQMRMEALQPLADGTFDLVLAFGVFQGARSVSEWDAAVAETVRVLRPDGELLVSQFSPDSSPAGHGVRSVSGQPHVYAGFSAQRRMVLLHAGELDARMARHGMRPVVPTASVHVTTDEGYRTTVNAHYRESGASTDVASRKGGGRSVDS